MSLPPTLRRAAAVTAAALALAACGPAGTDQPAVPDEPVDTPAAVAEAMAASLAGSYRFDANLDVAVDADELAAAATAAEMPVEIGPEQRELIDAVVDKLNAGGIHGVRSQTAAELGATWRGMPVASVAVTAADGDFSALTEALDADGDGRVDEGLDVASLDGVTVDGGLYGVIDLDVAQTMVDEFNELTGPMTGAPDTDVSQQLAEELAPLAQAHPELAPLVDALTSGQPAGVDGELDLGALLRALDASGELDELAGYDLSVLTADPDASYAEHTSYEQVTYDEASATTTAVMVVDVDEVLAAQAKAATTDPEADATQQDVEQALAQLEGLELTATVDLELVQGRLTRMTFDVLANLQANLAANTEAAGPYGQVALDVLAELDTTRLHAVAAFSDHGTASPVAMQDATTVDWATMLQVLERANAETA